MSPSENSILDLFEKNELLISELYKLYSERIPDQAAFWNWLSKEEVEHAREISEVKMKYTNLRDFQENKFSRGIINYVSGFVAEQIQVAKEKEITHLDAVNTALRVEQSMLEKKSFEIFAPTEKTLKEVLEKLNRDTNKHETILRQELAKHASK